MEGEANLGGLVKAAHLPYRLFFSCVHFQRLATYPSGSILFAKGVSHYKNFPVKDAS